MDSNSVEHLEQPRRGGGGPDIQQRIALGILIVSILALVIGVVNASLDSDRALEGAKGKSGKPSVASLLMKSNRLVLVELTGPIMMDAGQQDSLFGSETNAVSVRKALDEAAEDETVKGVLLHINSPGGTVAMSQELNAAVTRVGRKKPVVAALGDIAASGGYYTACAADKIVTNRGTLTASIGVIISSINMRGLFEDKLGLKAVTIKSGKYKDLLSPYRDTTADERALVQALINDSYRDFLDAVVTGRTRHFARDEQAKKQARVESIKAVADGRVVHGEEAVRAGLADEIGDLKRAYALLDAMAKERFRLKIKDKLPLENAVKPVTLLDLFGLGDTNQGSAALAAALRLPASAAGGVQQTAYRELMPLSLRYPNQPLWVLE